METRRYIIVCEGESEWTYLQRLQAFLNKQELTDDLFETPLQFICPKKVIVKTGSYGKLISRFEMMRKENKNTDIEIWTDFDLYHRNTKRCAELYSAKPSGIPDFLFSYHNFEDLFALHHAGDTLKSWLDYGRTERRHFEIPLHSKEYKPEIKRIFPSYAKGDLPVDFVNWHSLQNLKNNLHHQPKESNPHQLTGIRSFAEFLIQEIQRAYPGRLD